MSSFLADHLPIGSSIKLATPSFLFKLIKSYPRKLSKLLDNGFGKFELPTFCEMFNNYDFAEYCPNMIITVQVNI